MGAAAWEVIGYDRQRELGGHYGDDVRAWDDATDRWLTGEDLSHGPTPQTRHPDGWVDDGERAVGRPEDATGGVDDIRDTTQGPTPETRRTLRATKDEPGAPAAFEPHADRRRGPTSAATRACPRAAASRCRRACGAGPRARRRPQVLCSAGAAGPERSSARARPEPLVGHLGRALVALGPVRAVGHVTAPRPSRERRPSAATRPSGSRARWRRRSGR